MPSRLRSTPGVQTVERTQSVKPIVPSLAQHIKSLGDTRTVEWLFLSTSAPFNASFDINIDREQVLLCCQVRRPAVFISFCFPSARLPQNPSHCTRALQPHQPSIARPSNTIPAITRHLHARFRLSPGLPHRPEAPSEAPVLSSYNHRLDQRAPHPYSHPTRRCHDDPQSPDQERGGR